MLKHMNHEYFFTYQPGGHTLTQLLQKQLFLRGNVISFERRTVVLEVITRSGLNLL